MNAIAPLGILVAGAAAALVASRLAGARGGTWIGATAAGAALASALALLPDASLADDVVLVGEVALRADGVGVLLSAMASGVALAVLLQRALDRDATPREAAPLVLLAAAGVAGIGLARDLFNLYLFFEVMSLASFALVATSRGKEGREQAMRYLVVNAAGSTLSLVGIGLAYLANGTTALVARPEAPPALSAAAASLLIVGLGTKAAAAPMHAWLPGTYAAAPPWASAILAGATTMAGAFALAKATAALVDPVGAGFAILALGAATMTLGNLGALRQREPRRLLAFSSLAHGGYVLLALGVGIAYGSTIAFFAASFHAAAHAALKSGAFLALGAIERVRGEGNLVALRGAARDAPLASAALAIALLGLLGAPPTVGFLGKLFLGEAAASGAWILAVGFVANAALSAIYYGPLAASLFARGEAGTREERRATVAPLALAAFSLAGGIAPALLETLANDAAIALSGVVP